MTTQNRVFADQAQKEALQFSPVARMAEALKIDYKKLWGILSTTCFKPEKNGVPFSDEEKMYVLMIAEQLGINPMRREIWAFRGKNGSVQPIVSIDGWKAIMLRQPNFDGYQITYSDSKVKVSDLGELPEWAECTIWLKGQSHPTVERVYIQEVFVSSSPVWRKSPRLMLHHRALIQAIRFSFPVTGISDVGVTDDGDVIDGEDLVNERSDRTAIADTQPARQAAPAKPLQFETEKLDALATKAITMARQRNDYSGAFMFANKLEGEARQYVLAKVQKAKDEDQHQAMQIEETLNEAPMDADYEVAA
ncbi:MAG: recombinase RecT [Sutterellaceae bacterium]|nr:recombinase RecT [Sutterellaceae bacterium]